MPSRSRPVHRRTGALAVVASATLAIAGCGGSGEETSTGPLTVIDVGGTETRVVTPGTTPTTTMTTPNQRVRTPLHGVERPPVRSGTDPADLRATDDVIEELHDRRRIEPLGIVELDVSGPSASVTTSRPGRAVATCRAVREAAEARGLDPLKGVAVRGAGGESAIYLADQPGGCRRP